MLADGAKFKTKDDKNENAEPQKKMSTDELKSFFNNRKTRK